MIVRSRRPATRAATRAGAPPRPAIARRRAASLALSTHTQPPARPHDARHTHPRSRTPISLLCRASGSGERCAPRRVGSRGDASPSARPRAAGALARQSPRRPGRDRRPRAADRAPAGAGRPCRRGTARRGRDLDGGAGCSSQPAQPQDGAARTARSIRSRHAHTARACSRAYVLVIRVSTARIPRAARRGQHLRHSQQSRACACLPFARPRIGGRETHGPAGPPLR